MLALSPPGFAISGEKATLYSRHKRARAATKNE